MQCMYFLLMMIGGGFLIITLIMGEMFEFAHDLGDTIGGAMDHALDGIGFHGFHLGDHGDVSGDGESGPSPFSSRVVFAFVTAFGGMGTILTYYDVGALPTVVFSLLAGFAGGTVVWVFTFVMFRKSATTQLRDSDFIGVGGQVTLSIPGGTQNGEVTILVRGASQTKFAISSDGSPLSVGVPIVVTARSGGRLVVKRA